MLRYFQLKRNTSSLRRDKEFSLSHSVIPPLIDNQPRYSLGEVGYGLLLKHVIEEHIERALKRGTILQQVLHDLTYLLTYSMKQSPS